MSGEVAGEMSQDRRVVTTEQIIDAYIDLVAATGPKGPSVRSVAQHLFVSSGTLYERAGSIGVIADRAAAKVRSRLANELDLMRGGDIGPLRDWIGNNAALAIFVTNPHRCSVATKADSEADSDAASPDDGAVLAVLGAFVRDDGTLHHETAMAAALAGVPESGRFANVETDRDATPLEQLDKADLLSRLTDKADDDDHDDENADDDDDIDDDDIVASLNVIATAGIDDWTFQRVAEIVGRPASSLHANRSKAEVLAAVCEVADTRLRTLAADTTSDRATQRRIVEGSYFRLGCHQVERELFPAKPPLHFGDLVLRRYAIQLAANTEALTPQALGEATAVFAEALEAALPAEAWG